MFVAQRKLWTDIHDRPNGINFAVNQIAIILFGLYDYSKFVSNGSIAMERNADNLQIGEGDFDFSSPEYDQFFAAIGRLSFVFANCESTIFGICLILARIHNNDINAYKNPELPKSTGPLKQKIKFIKHNISKLPEKFGVFSRFGALLDLEEKISDIRNTLIHGTIIRQNPKGSTNVVIVRLHHENSAILQKYSEYSTGKIHETIIEAVNIANQLNFIFFDLKKYLE